MMIPPAYAPHVVHVDCAIIKSTIGTRKQPVEHQFFQLSRLLSSPVGHTLVIRTMNDKSVPGHSLKGSHASNNRRNSRSIESISIERHTKRYDYCPAVCSAGEFATVSETGIFALDEQRFIGNTRSSHGGRKQ